MGPGLCCPSDDDDKYVDLDPLWNPYSCCDQFFTDTAAFKLHKVVRHGHGRGDAAFIDDSDDSCDGPFGYGDFVDGFGGGESDHSFEVDVNKFVDDSCDFSDGIYDDSEDEAIAKYYLVTNSMEGSSTKSQKKIRSLRSRNGRGVHDDGVPFVCAKCGMGFFLSKGPYLLHMAMFHKVCGVCEIVARSDQPTQFRDEDHYNHARGCARHGKSGGGHFICSTCGDRHTSGKAVNQHCATVHMRCRVCRIQFDSPDDLSGHFSSSNVHFRKYCKPCKMPFACRKSLSAHRAAGHPIADSPAFSMCAVHPITVSPKLGKSSVPPITVSPELGTSPVHPIAESHKFGTSEAHPSAGSPKFGNSGASSGVISIAESPKFGKAAAHSTTTGPKFGTAAANSTTTSPKFGKAAVHSTTTSPKFGKASIDPTTTSPNFGKASIDPTTTSSKFGKASIDPTTTSPKFGKAADQATTTSPKFGKTAVHPIAGSPKFGKAAVHPITTSPKFGKAAVHPITTSPKFGKAAVHPITASPKFGKAADDATTSSSNFGKAGLHPTTTSPQFGRSEVQPIEVKWTTSETHGWICFECTKVRRQFTTEEQLEAHLEFDHIRCFPCKREFARRKNLYDHLVDSSHHNFCIRCDSDFMSAESLSNHNCPAKLKEALKGSQKSSVDGSSVSEMTPKPENLAANAFDWVSFDVREPNGANASGARM